MSESRNHCRSSDPDDELLQFCNSEFLSEEGLREICDRHWVSLPNISNYDFFFAACRNKLVNEGIIRCLLEYFPEAVAATNDYGSSPINSACRNKNVTLGIVQLLIDAAPDSMSMTNGGRKALHILCADLVIDEEEAIDVLKLLLEKRPESIRHVDIIGLLPIHYASGTRSPGFCRELIEAYPGSERIVDSAGCLPLHLACLGNSPATVEYFYSLYPDAINHTTTNGLYPIHLAMHSPRRRKNLKPVMDIVRYLLDCDPNVKLQEINGKSLLHYACEIGNDDSNLADIEMLKLLLEKCPESIRRKDNKGSLPIHFAARTRSPDFCRVLIEAYPGSERIVDSAGWLPLHFVCLGNSVATADYLYRFYPDAINHQTTLGKYPIHLAIQSPQRRKNLTPAVDIVRYLLDCDPNVKLQEINGKSLLQFACLMGNDDSNMADIEILKLLLEKCPESIRHTDDKGNLPIHDAARARSPEFCRVLIEAYPGSERISNDAGALPLHWACSRGNLDTEEYLYNLYPDSINHIVRGGYPIHFAFGGLTGRNSPTAAVDTVQFLLDCHTNVKLQKLGGASLLRFACARGYNDSNIDAALQIIKALYDAHPEAIEEGTFARNTQRFHQRVQTFINEELVHARKANDHRQMTTPDEIGQLPLHRALRNNVRLGSIKLLVKGNPSVIRTSDNNGALPLHVACQYHDSPRVVQYLIDLNATTLRYVDLNNDTALHYACCGAKYGTIALLLERHDAVSVSKQNAQQKLPIDLLWESDEVEDRESVEYLDSVFRLMKAYPEMLMNIGMQLRQRQKASASEMVKKRKFGAV